ncbi:hypothetical protein KL921_000117 [Ogataea angusta]|uniref:F-box protein n=1 Tax=Pichia angusta TaxID=870730 RepID=A0ABQ7S1K1_PICAN|nr:hypothetical protein KL921_000117 [Ogataea angusta]KAG7825525.1 hypothetical protein KL909_000757 [Ogataea angusta]KAG7832423.1 hypothetical protein KL943_005081 [Ogataea angusta]KAG7842327.1 hypothetical protein KL942_001065 [Ogataea angusta]KAG7851878.1 hypothetical protein KL940_000760 [Ogataea angusta]
MANKSRPKKTRGQLYKKYVYGVKENGPAGVGAATTLQPEVFSEVWNGYVWPRSQFQKVDVLKVSVALGRGMVVQEDRMKLPFELILLVLEHTENPYCLNHLLISRAFYYVLMPKLYYYPRLKSSNFAQFVDLVSQHQNKKRFEGLVKILDLSQIIQSGKNSYVSKLLRRFSGSLEVFIASQASFGLSPLISLRLCHNLKILDLRLVSETVNLKELFNSIKSAPLLEQLSFPRSSISCEDYDMEWPSKLWYLRLQGGISNKFLTESRFPASITSLEFAHCPNITGEAINEMLMHIGYNLRRLSIFYPMPKLKSNSLDTVFLYCPNLVYLYINIEYFSKDLFHDELLPPLEEYPRPLRTLCIDSSGLLGQGSKIHPDDLTIALWEERLPCLASLKVSMMLGWNYDSDSVQDLVNELEDRGGALYKM